MNLLRYTNRVIFLIVLFFLALWGTVFYFLVLYEVMDETDDALNNTREILIGKVLHNPELLHSNDSIMQRYQFRPITEEEAENYRETYFDSSVYIQTENEFEPVRVIKSCFRTADGTYYELTLMSSTLERDDLIRAIWWALVVLYVVLLLCTTLGVYASLKRVFRPLHRLVLWLQEMTPGKPVPDLENDTAIREFRILNDAALDMAHRAESVYREQKQFTENASHELQTPLAIIRGKLELLAESEGVTEKQLEYVGDMFTALNRVVQLNKSLLLLSRINNGQFIDSVPVDLSQMIADILEIMNDIYESKHIDTHFECSGAQPVLINESLAHVLVNNLLKNAMVHTPSGGKVEVLLTREWLMVKNSGDTPLDSEMIFRRFYHDRSKTSESTGLGLALVKSIADFYHLPLIYNYEGMHVFKLKIVNIEKTDANS